ncbi:MAG: hypothetical protein CM15mP115_04510 [Alphaproteobacteria bacterium]|nr:MAG: hypothetical protein CM15mP115_04510 [Alphaproteobacteria bacterium]
MVVTLSSVECLIWAGETRGLGKGVYGALHQRHSSAQIPGPAPPRAGPGRGLPGPGAGNHPATIAGPRAPPRVPGRHRIFSGKRISRRHSFWGTGHRTENLDSRSFPNFSPLPSIRIALVSPQPGIIRRWVLPTQGPQQTGNPSPAIPRSKRRRGPPSFRVFADWPTPFFFPLDGRVGPEFGEKNPGQRPGPRRTPRRPPKIFCPVGFPKTPNFGENGLVLLVSEGPVGKSL